MGQSLSVFNGVSCCLFTLHGATAIGNWNCTINTTAFTQILEVEIEEGNWVAAAQMCDCKRDLDRAAGLYEKAGNTLMAAHRLLQRAMLLLCPSGQPLCPTHANFPAASTAALELLQRVQSLYASLTAAAASSGVINTADAIIMTDAMVAVLMASNRTKGGGFAAQLRELEKLRAQISPSPARSAADLMLAAYILDVGLAYLQSAKESEPSQLLLVIAPILRAWPVFNSTAGSFQQACRDLACQTLGNQQLQLLRSCEILLGVSEDKQQNWMRTLWASKSALWLPVKPSNAAGSVGSTSVSKQRLEVNLPEFAAVAQQHFRELTAKQGV